MRSEGTRNEEKEKKRIKEVRQEIRKSERHKEEKG